MSTYKTRANIFIGGVKINKYKNIKVERSIDGSKATITYPDNLLIGEKYLYRTGSDTNPLATGQYVYIDMGWDKLLSDEFTTRQKNTYFDAVTPLAEESEKPKFIGFISKVTQNIKSRELVVECEDYNYLLKRINFDFSEKEISLKDLGQKLIDKLPKLDVSMNNDPNDFIFVEFNRYAELTTGLEFTLKKYVAEKATGYDILKNLSDDFNIKSVWIGSTLVLGVNYLNPNTSTEKEFRYTQVPRRKQTTNMLYALDSGGLTWQNSKDVKYKITANVVDVTLERTKYELGDIEDGQEREFWFYGEYKQSDVEALVENELSRLKYDGFKEGSKITTFGKMSSDYKERGINPLDTVILDGIDYRTELDGKKTVLPTTSYLCNGVTYTMDNKGFMAEITLGQFFPVKIESFYEVDSSFNTSNLDVSAKVIKFSGEETFNTATGSTSVVKVEEPVAEETVTDIKILKNILAKYKSSCGVAEVILQSLYGYWKNISGVQSGNTITTASWGLKNISVKRVDEFNLKYVPYGSSITETKYLPKYLEAMNIDDVKNLEVGDANDIKLFNFDSDNLNTMIQRTAGYFAEIEKYEKDGANWDISKLTNEETIYYNAYKNTKTTDMTFVIR